MAAFQMTDSQQVTLGPLVFKDKKGNPAPQPAGSTITWLVDNPALIALTPSADSLSCLAAAVGPLGSGTISAKVAAADGTPLAQGSDDCTIVGGAPTTVEMPVGTPVEQP